MIFFKQEPVEKKEGLNVDNISGIDSDSDDDNDVENAAFEEHDSHIAKELKVSISELYGLIFLALLQKQYWKGAKQLIETGCIRIHHILVGCVILENTANSWQTAPLVQDRLRRLNKAFTQRASRILESIYETDKKIENDKQKRNRPSGREVESNSKEEMELGEHINHAGRLLLNHGYIEDAIKTQNRTFLDNKEVRNIINKMWYGLEHRDLKTILGYIALAANHIILLPLLMVTMETRPTLWLYKQYKLPFMKVCIHLVGFLWLLFAYAHMLLFDYKVNGISHTDYFIITWMVSFFVDETKQHIVSIIRRKWKSYISDWWNRLDWCSIFIYTVGMCLKLGENQIYQDASKVLLVVAFILLCIRILNLFCMSEILGPKLVMIRKMFSDTGAFMAIMAVIMMCYNISFHALLYTNSEFTWSELEKITKNGYWMLFGELNLDGEKVTVPDCTFNRALFESGALEQCPSTFGLHLVPYLKAFYGLIAVILLLNLLIAMYSNTFKVVHEEAEFYWSQLQNDFLEEYSVKTIFPIHVQLLVLPMIILHAFIWFCCLYPGGKLYERCRCDAEVNNGRKDDVEDEKSLNRGPMFVRVFLYNTNFDLKLKSTTEAERNGTMKAKGEIDIMETDRITTKVGLRVVRPQSWKPASDYKFGNGREIGTIVKITESGDVTVRWDRGRHDNFEKGDNNQFDLLLFDNAQTGNHYTIVHGQVSSGNHCSTVDGHGTSGNHCTAVYFDVTSGNH
ncbi:transient receptor potential cation channel subfamily M member 2-like [Mytilus trossulus]|uniref:transient receptor potential cation channel subfamily M member 2-like n=1 Tax=Mytilus trossulus TaxID=6551 RepID=UPI00300638C8